MRMQSSFLPRPARSRLMGLLLLGAAIGVPVAIDITPGGAPVLSPAFAHARGGDDSGGDDNGGDDNGGRGRGGDDGDDADWSKPNGNNKYRLHHGVDFVENFH